MCVMLTHVAGQAEFLNVVCQYSQALSWKPDSNSLALNFANALYVSRLFSCGRIANVELPPLMIMHVRDPCTEHTERDHLLARSRHRLRLR